MMLKAFQIKNNNNNDITQVAFPQSGSSSAWGTNSFTSLSKDGHGAFKCYPDGNLIGNRTFAAQPLMPPYFDQLILNRTCAREHVAESMLLVVQIKCVLSEGVERYFCPNPIF